jgi:hypothetical protein
MRISFVSCAPHFQMDPLAHYCAKADYVRREYDSKINRQVDATLCLLPLWYAVPDHKYISGSAELEEEQLTGADWYEVWKRIVDEHFYKFEEFFLRAEFTPKLVVTWSWCPIEYRVLILAQVLPADLVKIIYGFADTTNEKAGRILEKFYNPTILDTTILLHDYPTRFKTRFLDGKFTVTKRVRARLLELVHQ